MRVAVSPSHRRTVRAAPIALAVAAAVSFAIAFLGSVIASAVTGLLVLAVGLRLAWVARGPEVDESRRSVLLGLGAAGVAAVAGGSAIGRVTERATRSDPVPDLDHMARSIGSDALLR